MERNRKREKHRASKRNSADRSKRSRRPKLRKQSKWRNTRSSAKNRALKEHKLQEGTRLVRRGKSAAAAARSVDLPPRELSRYLTRHRIARRVGKRWIFYKRGRRQMQTFSQGQIWYPTFNPAEASYNGGFLSALGQFRISNDPDHLKQFVGKSVTDIEGKEYPFETRPNVLYRLLAGTEPTEEIYRILT
jgi:hypothetical protein